jgi:hypothetical protein
MQPGKHTHSEQDWEWVMDELAHGKDAAKLTHALASRRADKPNPLYYAQRTVDMASARLWLLEGSPIDDVITMAEVATIPVRIKHLTDAEALEAQLVENLQRRDVHPLEEAQGFRTLLNLEEPKYSIEQLAAKTGKSPVYVATRLKLTELTQNVVDAVPVRLMKRDLLFVAERLASLLDENRLSIVARRYGIKKAKDSDSLGKLFAAYSVMPRRAY